MSTLAPPLPGAPTPHTQQTVTGATFEATWFTRSLSDLVPGFFKSLSPILEGFHIALVAAEIAIELVIALSALAIFVANLPDLLDVAVQVIANVLLIAVAAKVQDLRNTGFSAMILPITPGGMKGCAGNIKAALLNARDPRRPAFAPFSFLAGWGIIAAAPIDKIQAIFKAITKILLLSENLQNQSGNRPKPPANVYFDPFAANKVAGTARPLNLPPWMAVRLVDFIPGADDALLNLIKWLKSMVTPIRNPPIVDYALFVKALFDRIIAMITLIELIIALILSVFVDVPCKIISFDTQLGSTQDLVDSIPRWFDPGNVALADVPPEWSTCGIFSVIGSVEPVTPDAQMGILRDLFLPKIDPALVTP